MRIMHVIYGFNVGGSEAVARDIVFDLNHNVIHGVVGLESDGPLKGVFEREGIATYVINKMPHERLSPMFRIWKTMQQFKPDVVHTHHLYELFYSWPGALLAGASIIHTEHEYYSLMTPKARLRLRLLSRFCRAVTGVNEKTSNFLKNEVGIPARKIHTIVNGVHIKRYQMVSCRKEGLGFESEDRVVGIIARLAPVKDHATLLRAVKTVAKKQPKVKLLIIGDGEERHNLELLCAELCLTEHVLFLGTRNDIPELLACLDIFVLSSKEEGLPMSVLEAMAAGKPVVATGVGGVPSIVWPGETGFLVSPGDDSSMANALLWLLDNPEQADIMGKNGQRVIRQRYDAKKSIAGYYSLYSSA